MAIKKVEISLSKKTYLNLGRIDFYTKIDGEWAKYNVGSKISDTETDNVYISSTSGIATVSALLGSYFKTTNNKLTTDTITIEFKEPLDVLQSINYCSFNENENFQCTVTSVLIYDEDDIIIFSKTSDVPSSTKVNTSVTLETPDLEYIRTYTTNKISYIETTDTNQLKQVFAINTILISCKEIKDTTYCRFLFSFDGRQTYKTFDNESKTWIVCNKEDIIQKGLSKDDLEATIYKYISNGLEDTATIDILVGMMTTDPIKTPSIQKIAIDYLKIKDDTTV